MRALQMLLLAAIFVALSVIAIDLHRLVGTLQPDGATMTYLFGAAHPKTETAAEHDARLQRETLQNQHDFEVILQAGQKPVVYPPRKKSQPSQ